jgi:hypothetical protein
MSLKNELDKLDELFKQRLNGTQKATLRWVEATAVDWENRTMTAVDEADLPYHDVLLGVGMMAVKPVLHTDCLIAIVENDESSAFLLYANEAEEIVFNGGQLGGMVKVDVLKDVLSKTNALLSAITGVINGAQVLEPGNSAPSALQIAMKSAISGKSVGDFNEIEDNKIKH